MMISFKLKGSLDNMWSHQKKKFTYNSIIFFQLNLSNNWMHHSAIVDIKDRIKIVHLRFPLLFIEIYFILKK